MDRLMVCGGNSVAVAIFRHRDSCLVGCLFYFFYFFTIIVANAHLLVTVYDVTSNTFFI
jgi:hypothetical protein